MSKISEEIFKKLNIATESALQDILNDISKRYDIKIEELETEYLDDSIKKKKNGYNKYNSKRRKELLEDNPNMDFGEMSKIIGEEWRNLKEEDKKKYN